MLNTLRLGLVVLLAGTAFAHADAKVETLPAEQVMKAERYTVSIPETSTTEVIAAFQKQTGLAVTLGSSEARSGGPAVLASLEFKNLPRDEALDRFGRAIAMRVQFEGSDESPTIRLYDGGAGLMNNSGRRRSDSDLPTAQVTGVYRNQSLPPSKEMGQALSINVEVSPGAQPITGSMQVNLIEAIDDQNRQLTAPKNRGGMMFSSGGQVMRSAIGAQFSLTYVDPMPKRIKSFKGEVVLQKPKTIRRVTAEDFADKAVSVDYGDTGGKLVIGPAKREGDRTDVKFRLERGKMPDAEWQKMNNFYNALGSAKLTNAAGQPINVNGRGSGGDGKSYEVTINCLAPQRSDGTALSKEDAAKASMPAKVTWDMVVEVEEFRVPVEASDLPVP